MSKAIICYIEDYSFYFFFFLLFLLLIRIFFQVLLIKLIKVYLHHFFYIFHLLSSTTKAYFVMGMLSQVYGSLCSIACPSFHSHVSPLHFRCIFFEFPSNATSEKKSSFALLHRVKTIAIAKVDSICISD